MTEASGPLIEHFFRHESANLIAVLTRAFGVRRLDLVEDMVQAAMLEAMRAWRQQGVPTNPAGWIHRVAKNRILDALRRERTHAQALAHAGQTLAHTESLLDTWLEPDEIPDSLLRMMFVCCHPTLDRKSQIALTLKVLCGFGVGEIARGLLLTEAAAKKRIQRARKRLAELRPVLEVPPPAEREQRLDAVHDVLYLLFNEGYSTSSGHDPIRDDLCEEAARLCHMLCTQGVGSTTTEALLALMLCHAARLGARIDADGAAVLLEDQDRSTWDMRLVRFAEDRLARAHRGPLTRFHLEATIALHHCRAASVATTDWAAIAHLYDRLATQGDSPLFVLNRAIARGQAGALQAAHADLDSIAAHPDLANYYLLDCARARLYELANDRTRAIDCYLAALSRGVAPHEQALLEKKMRALSAP